MTNVVIVDAVRTPIGKRNGGLSTLHPAEVLASVQQAIIERTGMDPSEVGQIVNGTVSQVDRVRSVGNLRSVAPGMSTTSHSRPLARWTVSSLTESASDGVATSRPWP